MFKVVYSFKCINNGSEVIWDVLTICTIDNIEYSLPFKTAFNSNLTYCLKVPAIREHLIDC